ncbi:MAG: hypothetical protein M0P31_02245 [Solirubrobacteraceae bacterium]|nr:hypothetical protein [Solirubrobacteraceae bacterium]
MSRRIIAAAVPTAALLAVAVPATTQAATITPTKACYTRVPTKGSEPIVVNITGGIPGGRFQVFDPGNRASSTTGTFDALGNATAAMASFSTGSINPSKGKTLQIKVQEFTPNGPVETGSTTVKVTNLSLSLARTPRSAYARRTWRVSGITPLSGGNVLYATWRRGNKTVKRIRLGKANACGYLKVRKSAIPRSKHRRFKLYVHSGKKFSSKKPFVGQSVRVIRRYF